MNYKKIILVGFISAFVAILTSVLGVTGTVIGSVISSVLYNMLSEALEKPVATAKFRTDFEWEIAYIFPLVVIGFIQLMLILAMLSESGVLPVSFLNAFLTLQHLADNNLYRILGIAMLIISVYPLVVKPDIIKKSHGVIIAIVGVIFLARGFVDFGSTITDTYSVVFVYFDFPIAVIALILILFVIYKILISAKESNKEFRLFKHDFNEENFSSEKINKSHHSSKHDDFDYNHKRNIFRVKNHKVVNQPRNEHEVTFNTRISRDNSQMGINESSDKIHFESNDLLDDYKK